ncbi:DUF1320 family protein [bacterium]|nr:DUF1320 family protein [bacterium]
MAVYTSIEDLEKRLDPQVLAGLADDVNPVPDIDDSLTREIIQQAIGDGGSLIDSYLTGRVDLGDSQVQASLERINATLALYFLYRRRYVDDSLNPLSASREAVESFMVEVASGAARLGVDPGQPQQQGWSTTTDAERVFDGRRLSGF